MSEFFLTLVNMSISASYIVLVVLLLRLLLKKAPKWIAVLLWGIVALRLICPFTIESALSLIPSAQTISPEIMTDETPQINSGIPFINYVVNPVISESFAPEIGASANPLQICIPILAAVWLVGVAGMLLYTVISYFRVKRKIGTAVLLRDNIFQSENVVSPFVLGVIKPKIYLPFNMNEQDKEHVIAHEQAHISRKDYLWKPLGFLILTLHWFNPLLWLSYVLLCRDIELACDEKVIKELDKEQKADYSQALLTCSVNRRMIAACPLAFGEVGVKNRVKSVLNYKKPAFWIIIIAVVASVVMAVCFLTNPRITLEDELSVFIDMQIAEHHYSEKDTDGNFIAVHHKVLGYDRSLNEATVYMWVLYHEYSCENGELQLESGAHIPTVIRAKRTGKHGHYELVEYWEPRDGSYYADDIRAKFPLRLHYKALDSQRYIDEQIAFCENAAKEYFSVELNVSGVLTLEPVEIVYDDGMYSFVQTVDTAPTYMIVNDMQLLEKNDGNVSGIIGTFEEITINKNNFDSRFREIAGYSWLADDTLKSIKDNNKRAWQLYGDASAETPRLYILLEQEDGTFYIGYGYYNCNSVKPENPDDSHIRWLYKVKKSSQNNGTVSEPLNSANIDALKEKYPQYFELSTENGLEVYIWQLASNSYSCGLLPGKDGGYAQQELWYLHTSPASLAEMRTIVDSYNLPKSDVTIHPVVMPHSSYAYVVDDAYRNELTQLFWSDLFQEQAANYSPIMDTATFDIDDDGIAEECVIECGPTSGLFTFIISAFENGKLEYFNIFDSPYLQLSFEENEDGETMLIGKDGDYTRHMGLSVYDGNIIIGSDEQDLSYWGAQGVNSLYAPK